MLLWQCFDIAGVLQPESGHCLPHLAIPLPRTLVTGASVQHGGWNRKHGIGKHTIMIIGKT